MQTNYSQTPLDFSIPDAPTFDNPPTRNSPTPNDKPQPTTREVTIDSIRLTNRGDISNSYSADVIDKGKIRKPFRYNGQLYTTTSTRSGTFPQPIRQAEAYRLVIATLFDGQITDFHTKIHHDNGRSARSDPSGFYHGIAITHQSRQYVLAGPPLTFLPNLSGT